MTLRKEIRGKVDSYLKIEPIEATLNQRDLDVMVVAFNLRQIGFKGSDWEVFQEAERVGQLIVDEVTQNQADRLILRAAGLNTRSEVVCPADFFSGGVAFGLLRMVGYMRQEDNWTKSMEIGWSRGDEVHFPTLVLENGRIRKGRGVDRVLASFRQHAG